MSDTLVFIPAWNEEQNIRAVIEELHSELPEADVLVVDDGSTDHTAEVARRHGAEVLSLEGNQGLRIGIASGSLLAARWSGKKVELGLVPLGGMVDAIARFGKK
jgi:glycosyltransferase involved in cell wall biosynthesis